MSKGYHYYIHSLVSVYVTDNYLSAYSRACDLAASDEFILFFDSEKQLCIHHIDELTAYNENMKV